jgi:hypothetical protein
MTRVAGQQPRGRGHVRRGDHRGVDDRVPVPGGQHQQVLTPGPVSVQRLGSRTGLTVLAPGEGGHIVPARYCLVNDGSADEPGAP